MSSTHHKVRDAAFWIYGVLVGAIIKESIDTGLPYALPTNDCIHPNTHAAVRFITVLVLVIRFYLGAIVHFGECYNSEKPTGRSFLLDFVLGLIHFAFFFGLVQTIPIKDHGPEWIFPTVLVVILLYDIPWWCIIGSTKRVRLWTAVNVLTVLLMGMCYFPLHYWAGLEAFRAQTATLCLVLVISAADMAEVIGDTPIFAPLIEKIIKLDGEDPTNTNQQRGPGSPE